MAEQKVHIVLWKEGDGWVAWCLEYDVASQGDTEEHALAMIREAVELHIEDASEDELERLYQDIEGEPRVHERSIKAPSLLHT